jgi:alpha,alpha-trehalase
MDNLNYGAIGNGKSAALVSIQGSIDWLCLPDFNSQSVFAKILDNNIGGEFSIEVDEGYSITQKYHQNTNILITSFVHGENHFEIWDFMPLYKLETGAFYNPSDLIRYIKVLSGNPVITVNYNPRLNYGGSEIRTFCNNEYIKSFSIDGDYESVYLYSNLNLRNIRRKEKISLVEDAFFLLTYNEKIHAPDLWQTNLELQRTEVFWLNWVEKGKRFNKYSKEIIRSALILRLLTFNKTGAILAAITTSLPETIGEVRNWDYRFCWIRDASMIVSVLSRIGYKTEARRFLDFILEIVPTKDDKIQIMYGIRGERTLTETTLDHLSGYENSRPVRIGNEAYIQKQNDIYGVLMDVIYQEIKYFKVSLEQSEDLWTITRSIVRSVENFWRMPDKSIWEIRKESRHFTFSKVLCWVAVDRGVKIAEMLGKEYYAELWSGLSEQIRKDIMEFAWNEKLLAFTQYYGSDDTDAANLLMEYYGFIEASDPRYVRTVKLIYEDLQYNGLMYRYKNNDDFGKPSSSFTICTFWMIQSLYKIGEKEKAVEMFDNLLKHANHLGLFSEDIDFESKRLLGNFPQGYSHLALIETAILISGELTTDTGFNIVNY